MKHCIWCRETERTKNFSNKAHTVPKQLGGRFICDNVCDQCNSYFGSVTNKMPSIETILKETFNITRTLFLHSDQDIGRNKTMARFSSIYFNVDLKNRKLSIKSPYKYHQLFQETVARQLKRGIYKMYLEERERQFGDSHHSQFDFIREFARYNIGDYPVFYFKRSYAIIPMVQQWARHPHLILTEEYQMRYLVSAHGYTEIEFLSHVFGFPLIRSWEISASNYLRESMKAKGDLFKSVKPVTNFNDIDLALSIFNDG
jgi:hypothetical protein